MWDQRVRVTSVSRLPSRSESHLALFHEVGIKEAGRCLDVGCGGGHVSIDLARLVGPAGLVVGLDIDEELLGLAREKTADRGLRNVEFRVGRAEELAESGYDLVHTRYLLYLLREPQGVLAAMAAALPANGARGRRGARGQFLLLFPA